MKSKVITGSLEEVEAKINSFLVNEQVSELVRVVDLSREYGQVVLIIFYKKAG